MLWHIGFGLPWNWWTGPADSSERAHLLEMFESLPATALVVADAGFVGHGYWKAIVDSGRHFLIRVGTNLRLLKRLGCARETNQIVYTLDRQSSSKESTSIGPTSHRDS